MGSKSEVTGIQNLPAPSNELLEIITILLDERGFEIVEFSDVEVNEVSDSQVPGFLCNDSDVGIRLPRRDLFYAINQMEQALSPVPGLFQEVAICFQFYHIYRTEPESRSVQDVIQQNTYDQVKVEIVG
ncbi:hypothetical protein ACFL1B_03910 [Nanoarchaeota archaeon]